MKKEIFFASGLIILIIFSFFYIENINEKKEQISTINTCNDGTFYDTCSLTKPYYCQDGILIEKSSLCGCSELSGISQGDSCDLNYKGIKKEANFSYFINGEKSSIKLDLYGEFSNYTSTLPRSLNYLGQEKIYKRDFILQKINEETQREFLLPLVIEIENKAEKKEDQARIAISFVQNIPFGESEKKYLFKNISVSYIRYPYEVLYDNEGTCEEKTTLLAFLLKEIGYDSSLFYYQEENHVALGIKCPIEESFNQTGYCFIETSGPAIISDNKLTYIDEIKLNSYPEISPLSGGYSLNDDLDEYDDAEEMIKIRNSLEKTGKIGPIRNSKLKDLNGKYGIVSEYAV